MLQCKCAGVFAYFQFLCKIQYEHTFVCACIHLSVLTPLQSHKLVVLFETCSKQVIYKLASSVMGNIDIVTSSCSLSLTLTHFHSVLIFQKSRINEWITIEWYYFIVQWCRVVLFICLFKIKAKVNSFQQFSSSKFSTNQ